MALECLGRGTHSAEALPLDVLPLILAHLSDRRDLCTCALLSKAFHNAATPLLYRTLDVRVVKHRRLPVSCAEAPHNVRGGRLVLQTSHLGMVLALARTPRLFKPVAGWLRSNPIIQIGIHDRDNFDVERTWLTQTLVRS